MNLKPIQSNYDAVIVGARCAGAATGMLLASAGMRVLVFDKAAYGSDTLSTHALMRPAVLLLRRWGLVDALEHAGTPRIRRTSFHYADANGAESISVDIKPRHGVDALYAPRRTALDRIIVNGAREAGADVRHGVQMLDLLRSAHGRVTGVRLRDDAGIVHDIRAGIVIGADGRRSSVARLAGSTPYALGRHATTCAFGYFKDLPVDGNHWFYRPGMGAGLIPTNDRMTCVFASVPRGFGEGPMSQRKAVFQRAIAEVAPDFAAPIAAAAQGSRLRFFPGMRGFLRQPYGDGWALVGDAGYMTDPITAHGITNALRDAELLSRSIIEGTGLAGYQWARDDLSLKFFEVSDRVAALDWDIPTVQQYHRMMSQEMGREEEALVGLFGDGVGAGASLVAPPAHPHP